MAVLSDKEKNDIHEEVFWGATAGRFKGFYFGTS